VGEVVRFEIVPQTVHQEAAGPNEAEADPS